MRQRERGSNLVELAIVLPFLLLMFAAVADIGRAFQAYIVITNAAREGARAAMRLPCYSKDAAQRGVYRDRVISIVKAEVVGNGLTVAAADITITPDPLLAGCQSAGGRMQVAVVHRLPTLVGNIIGLDPIVLRSTTSMPRLGNDQAP